MKQDNKKSFLTPSKFQKLDVHGGLVYRKEEEKNYAAAHFEPLHGSTQKLRQSHRSCVLVQQTKGPVLLLDAAVFNPFRDVATDLKQTRERRKRKRNPLIIMPRHSSCTTAHNLTIPPNAPLITYT
jgi:hypothetical protein